MPGLRVVRWAAAGCALVLAGAVVLTAAEVPGRLLFGMLQVLIAVVLAAPYLAVVVLLRKGAGPGRLASGLALARGAGWATVFLAGAFLALSWKAVQRTGPPRGELEILAACLLLLPLAIAVLLATRRLSAARADARPSRLRVLLAGLAVGATFLALPLTLSFQSAWKTSWLAEGVAIGDLRAMISAQAAYASVNGDAHGPPECLVRPAQGLPGYQGPVFLDPAFLRPVRAGYLHVFLAGPPPSPPRPGSYAAWAYVALPVDPGFSGGRGFCANESGELFVIAADRLPTITDGRCPPGEPLR